MRCPVVRFFSEIFLNIDGIAWSWDEGVSLGSSNGSVEIISGEADETIAIIKDAALEVLEDINWMDLESELKLMRLGEMSWILW